MNQSRALNIAFLAGSLTSFFLFLIIFLFFGYRIGGSKLLEKVWRLIVPIEGTLLYLPDSILSELIAINAVVDNANNPTKQRRHDTILVQPHDELQFALRPDVRISASMLRTLSPFNFDPPVLHFKSDAKISDALRNYLDQQTRLSYTYGVDADGFRVTVPVIKSKRKILLVGDSVLFGVGVNDDSTIASHLQRIVGESFQVINAGVGSYNGEQAFQMANLLSGKDRYEALIYVACQNDFDNLGVENAKVVMERFASLRNRFSIRDSSDVSNFHGVYDP